MAKEQHIATIEDLAQKRGGQVYNHYWSDIAGLRWALFDTRHEYQGNDGILRVQDAVIGDYDLRVIPAGWIGNCFRWISNQQSKDQVKMLKELGVGNPSIKRNLAKLGEPVMISTGRRGVPKGQDPGQVPAYGLPQNGETGYYYSSDEIYQTGKRDTLLKVVFAQPEYQGQTRVKDRGQSGYALYRLGPALLAEVAAW